MAKLGDLILRVGADTSKLNKDLGDARKTIAKNTREIQNLGRNLTVGITAPLVAIGASSVKVFADFEQSMAKVKAVSGATSTEFESLTNNAKELGRTTRFTASEVSALQLEFAKLGFTSEEITQVTGATLNLAQATGSDLAQSAEVAGATLRAFGLDASETGHVTDVMAAAFSSSALDINSFQDSMKFVAPVAKAAGVTLEEATAMLGQLANNGIKGSNAGTSLRRILQEVAGTGMDFGEAMKKSAGEVINLADAKDEVGRTASSAFLVLKEGMGDVDGLTAALEKSNGAAKEMADTMDDTAEGAFKKMMSAIEGAQIEIGSKLAPGMIKLAGVVTDVAGKFSGMSEGAQMAIIALGGVASQVGPMLVALPHFAQGLKIAKIQFGLLNKTMAANPFGLVAAGITVLVGAIIMLTDETKDAVSAVDKLAEANKGLGLEEQKRNIQKQIEDQEKLVEELEKERDAKQALVDQNYGGKAIKEAKESAAAYAAATSELDEMNAMLTNVNESLNSNAESTNIAGDSVTELGNNTEQTTAKLKDKSNTLGFLMNKLEEVPNTRIWQPVKESTDEANNSLGALFNRLEETPVQGFTRQLTFAESMMQAMSQTATSFGNIIGAAFADMISGAKKGKDAMKDMAKALISAALAASQASIIEAMINSGKFTGPAAPIVIPALVASGVALVQGLFNSLPAFADGGIVSGPTLGLVGEYPGAKTNPEVIAPLDKLRGMLGGQAVQVTGKISGRDILLTSERNAIDRNRVRGF